MVPRHYLAGFSDDSGRIIQIRLARPDQPADISNRDAAVRRNFYTVNVDGQASDEVERLFQQAESLSAVPLRKLAEASPDFSQDDKEAVAAWAALQFLRGDDLRQALSDAGEMVLKATIRAGGREGTARALARALGRPPTEEEVDDHWEAVSDFEGWRLTPRVEEQVFAIRDNIVPATYAMLQRSWTVLTFFRKRLGTSDVPVVVVPPPSGAVRAAGYMNAELLLLPLSRDSALMMGPISASLARSPVDVRQGTTQWSRTINNLIAGTARHAVYHHPEDEPFTGVELPPPRDREIDGLT